MCRKFERVLVSLLLLRQLLAYLSRRIWSSVRRSDSSTATRTTANTGAPHVDGAAAAHLGAEHAQQGRYGEAIEALRAAPRDADTANLLGVCLTLVHRYDEAVAQYDAALALNPSLADAWANAGWTLRLLGRDEANRYFRRWLRLATAGQSRYALAAPPARLALPEVALCCADSAYRDLAARALRASLEGCVFGDALFASDRDCGVEGVRFVPIAPLRSLQDYSNFMIHGLHAHVSSGHALVVQYDGFVLHPQAWDPRFLDYDYLGPAVRLPDGSAGGIGGFSLRSRRLLEALRDDPDIRRYDAARESYAEDIAICCAFRRILEQRHGIRFAPATLADRFAAEALVPGEGTFGFHGLMHLVSLHQNGFRPQERPEEGLHIAFRASTAAGPLAVRRTLELRARGDAWARFLPAG